MTEKSPELFKAFADLCIPEELWKQDIKPFPFQYEGIKFLWERSRALLASDPGTGKTVMLIVAVNILAHQRASLGTRVLVLCPKSIMLNWQREIDKWGTKAWPIEWQIHNWDRLVQPKRVEKLLEKDWDVIIGDESHQAVKNPDAQRCKIFIDEFLPKTKRCWLATATPASRSGVDYFCTLKILLPTLFEKWTKWHFMKEFCEAIPDRWAPKGIRYEGFNNTAILKELFSKCAVRHKKEEVLPDLPPKIYTNIEVEIDKRVLAEMLKLDIEEVIRLIENDEPLPGHIAHVLQAVATAKLDAVAEIIENLGEKESVVAFAWHRAVVFALAEKLGNVPTITGKITDNNIRQKIVDEFADGVIKKVVMNFQSGGVGLNFTAARTAVYAEIPHSPIHLVQSENRVHRIGSKHDRINIIRVIAKDGYDEQIFKVLDARVKKIREVGV